MGPESTLFFAPGADPWHEAITPWQQEFHKLMGTGNATLFDEKFRALFHERDHLTFLYRAMAIHGRLFNGAMGFTYEQGGGGTSGLAYKLEIGRYTHTEGEDRRTLSSHQWQQLKYHMKTGKSWLVNSTSFLRMTLKNPSFRVQIDNHKRYQTRNQIIESLFQLLDRNQIRYSYAGSTGKNTKDLIISATRNGEVTIEKGDILISALPASVAFYTGSV
ncbi:MAG: hypothetical protein MZV63_37005 [Marinilabiliales bacterium]|nr:hypothetical protein [Marinilabiliales bacterium]